MLRKGQNRDRCSPDRSPLCRNCGGEEHRTVTCKNKTRCLKCAMGEHQTGWKTCKKKETDAKSTRSAFGINKEEEKA